jgi:hypothetical protein
MEHLTFVYSSPSLSHPASLSPLPCTAEPLSLNKGSPKPKLDFCRSTSPFNHGPPTSSHGLSPFNQGPSSSGHCSSPFNQASPSSGHGLSPFNQGSSSCCCRLTRRPSCLSSCSAVGLHVSPDVGSCFHSVR